MAFGTPQSDDEPKYDALATLLAGYKPAADAQGVPTAGAQPAAPAQAPQQAQVSPVAAAAPQTTAAQPPQPPTASAPTQPAIVLPSAPQAPTVDMEKYRAMESQLATDKSATPKVSPKWWERLAGAAVGFGAGYHGDVAGGIRAGSAVTDRRQIAADEDQAKKVSADQSQLDQFGREQDMQTKGFENQVRGFDANMQSTRAQQEQSNNDRSFNEGVRTSDRDFGQRKTQNDYERQLQDKEFTERQTEFNANNKRETANSAEAARHNKADEGLRGAEIADNRDARDKATKASSLRQGVDANALNATRQKAYKALDEGDPVTGTLGYNDRLKAIQKPTAIDPNTQKKYTDADRAAAIEQLNAEHAAGKQQIEASYSTGLQNLGVPAEAVQYDANGRPLNNTNGTQPGTAGTPPAAAAAAPPAAAAAAPQQGAPPKGNGKPLTDVAIATQYLKLAGGDKAKARALAQKDHWKF